MQHVSTTNDVTVIGGGLAGVAAAIAAARRGSTVALVTNRPVLGGNASSEIRVWVCGATAHGAQKYARETGIMGELFWENQYRNPEGNPYFWDQVVHDAVRAEPNISLYLNTDVREVEADGPDDARTIASVTGWQMGAEKLVRFESSVFIDCTGDGLVGLLAGAWYRTGREAADEFGEEWAPDVPDENMLGSTLFFYTKDTGKPVRYVPPSIAKDIAETSIVRRRRIDPQSNGCDYWWIEWGGELDAVDDNEQIRDELWAVVYGIWDHIKNSGEFDADTLTLEWVGSLPGKREYRRFVGDHVLTQQDVMSQTVFPDRVGFGGWSIDLHPPGGMYSEEAGSRHLFTSGVYHIPFRSLYSANVTNMLMAGRNISASHVAFGTTRVMATCAVVGEAAGAGAALSARYGITPRELVADRLGDLQRSLLVHDSSVLGLRYDDPADLASTALLRASSSLSTIGVEPRGDEEVFVLDDRDAGIVLPVDHELNDVEVLLEISEPADVEVELWSTAGGENHIPVRKIAGRSVRCDQAGRAWLATGFSYAADDPEEAVVVVRRNPQVALVVDPRPGPYGVLGLFSREPRSTTGGLTPPTNAWSAFELRRMAPCVRVGSNTDAYLPAKVAGGYQRPYNGPQLWSSHPMRAGESEWLTLDWDVSQEIAQIDLIFNDDVDIDLINLHHHETPFAVAPELVRDYRIEALADDGTWLTVASETDNRRRHREHVLAEPVLTTGLRLTIEATNGSEWATVAGIRAFGVVGD